MTITFKMKISNKTIYPEYKKGKNLQFIFIHNFCIFTQFTKSILRNTNMTSSLTPPYYINQSLTRCTMFDYVYK